MAWLGVYWGSTPGLYIGDNTSIRLTGENMPQPDALLMIEPDRGGQATLTDDDYVEGGPELVVEVAGSTASIDLNAKFRVYRRNNVCEYLVWRVLDRAIDWFVLVEGEYQRQEPGAYGVLRSQVRAAEAVENNEKAVGLAQDLRQEARLAVPELRFRGDAIDDRGGPLETYRDIDQPRCRSDEIFGVPDQKQIQRCGFETTSRVVDEPWHVRHDGGVLGPHLDDEDAPGGEIADHRFVPAATGAEHEQRALRAAE